MALHVAFVASRLAARRNETRRQDGLTVAQPRAPIAAGTIMLLTEAEGRQAGSDDARPHEGTRFAWPADGVCLKRVSAPYATDSDAQQLLVS